MATLNKVTSKPQNISIKDIIKMIDHGYELQNIEDVESIDDERRLELTDALILTPDYQREYCSSVKDESSLIESLILGIPIPPIFLSNDRYEGIKVLNVVDGQHRLRAFHRFCKNKYKLIDMKFLTDLENQNYDEVPFTTKEIILGSKLSSIVFEDFPGLDYELEIFSRYNKGTKPLSNQDIRHAVYNSKLNHYVNNFVKMLMETPEKKYLKEAYNVTKDRFQKKRVQESIFVILSILEKGINLKNSNAPIYAENYMKEKSELESENITKAEENFLFIKNRFEEFNQIIEKICKFIKYPFSKEIYGVSSRNYKFQMSKAMIISGIFNKMFEKKSTKENFKDENLKEVLKKISDLLKDSYLEDPEYTASSTNSIKIKELIEKFNV